MDLNGYKETAVPVFKDNCKICFLEGQQTLEQSNLETVDQKTSSLCHFTEQITQWSPLEAILVHLNQLKFSKRSSIKHVAIFFLPLFNSPSSPFSTGFPIRSDIALSFCCDTLHPANITV